MTVGEIIYNRRKELGLTLEEIGNATGVSKSTVKKWENGFIANMRRDKIEKLAKILQISPIVLLGNKNEDDKPNAEILSAGENKPAARQLTDRQEKIVDLFDVLTEPQQDNIIGRAETFAEQNEKDFQRQESV